MGLVAEQRYRGWRILRSADAGRRTVRGMSSKDVVALDDGTLVEYGPRAHPLLHLGAPLVAAAAVWAARQGINRAYTRIERSNATDTE